MKKLFLVLFLVVLSSFAYADRIDEPMMVTVTSTSTLLYAADPNIHDIRFTNSGSTAVYLCCTATAQVGHGEWVAGNGGFVIFDQEDQRHGPFSAITSSGTTTITVSAHLTP